MSNARSTQLRPVVSLLALLVVASMVIAAPASAKRPTYPAPTFDRAVIALRASDAQAIAAKRQLAAVERRMREADRRVARATAVERAVRVELGTAHSERVAGLAAALLTAARERVRIERAHDALDEDLAYVRTLARKAQAHRAVVLGGLSLTERQRVLRAERKRQQRVRARRLAVQEPAVLDAPPLAPAVVDGGNGTTLAAELEGPAALPDASGVGAIAAAYALTQVGAPYRAGGYSPASGFDCSGLLYWSFAQAGLGIPRSSWQIWDAGRRVTRAQAQPGDIVSFHGEGHTGIYLGEGLYVHSTQSGDVVSVHALDDRGDLDGFVRIG